VFCNLSQHASISPSYHQEVIRRKNKKRWRRRREDGGRRSDKGRN